MEHRKPRRPAMLSPEQAQQIPGGVDPALRSEAAHTTAAAIVYGARARTDPEIVQRLVRLVETEGLDVVAELWSNSPGDTLPGALWRLYQLRDWVQREPQTVADRYRAGVERAEVAGAVAGVASPPGPDDVLKLADAVLSGVFAGDLGVALERAGAFCRVLATGSALAADAADISDDAGAGRITRGAGALLTLAEELDHAADLWRRERLE